jgi:hypothetical protein
MIEDANEDDDGEGLDLETADLKKMLKKGEKRTLMFAYSPPAGKDGEPIFTLHLRKNPKALCKDVKDEKKDNDEKVGKTSFGKLDVKDGVVTLDCVKVLPGLEKKLTKMFRKKRAQYKIKVLGAPGGDVA